MQKSTEMIPNLQYIEYQLFTHRKYSAQISFLFYITH